jgi:hypothetical protein
MKIYRLNQAEFRLWRDRALRTELIQKIHADRGPTQVRAPSGVILGTARGTTERVPIERARIRGAHHAVSPGECVCREWQKPEGKQDQHHPICRLKSVWEAQLAHSPDLPRERAILTVASPKAADTTLSAAVETPSKAGTPPTAAIPSKAAALRAAPEPDSEPAEPELPPAVPPPRFALPPTSKPSRVLTPAPDPADCACQDWAGIEEGRHHRICEFRERWEREHNIQAPVLVELETGEVAREATPDEAAASKAKALDDGIGAIELSDGHHYYVRQP